MSGPRAVLCSVGDELLAGKHPDLNAPFLARELLALGVPVVEVAVVGDDEEAIATAVQRLATRAELVFVTGGLGPTLDDVTRHAVARAAGRELVEDPDALAQVSAWYRAHDRAMPASNARQALVPRGATVLPNPVGTAPGFQVPVGGAAVRVLPGPPSELRAMWEQGIGAGVRAELPQAEARVEQRFHLQGLSESQFSDDAGTWLERGANPLVGVTVARGLLTARLVARGADESEAARVLEPVALAFRERFAPWIFSEECPTPEEALVTELAARGLEVACAESCTGGLVAGALTAVPGSSAVLAESFVTYSNAAKRARLSVADELLEAHGAVSEEVAGAMAEGVVRATGADLGLATSGIAGPGGGTPEKPVGLVCFGVRFAGRTWTGSRTWPGRAGRTAVRDWATAHALVLGLKALQGRLPAPPGA